MPRILGVDIPRGKTVWIALTYIHGIGRTRSAKILKEAGIDPQRRVHDLSDEEIARVTEIIQRNYRIEGDLRRDVAQNIRRLMEINCYRGLRHKRGLPVRGQKTKTNARTRKGPHGNMLKRKKK